MKNNYQFLRDLSNEIDPKMIGLTREVIDNPDFGIWPGSIDGKHHCNPTGLRQHTREVVELCFNTAETLGTYVDKRELFLAGLYHDIGKIHDYEMCETTNEEPMTKWKGSHHKRIIHHISRSALIWSHAVSKRKSFMKYHDPVLHAILSHHGQREWGSPVAPFSKVAWLVHLCDGLSARVNDCEKVDYLKVKDKS